MRKKSKKAEDYFKKAQRFLKKSDIPHALFNFKQACRHAPDNLKYSFRYADVLYDQKQFEEAETVYCDALAEWRKLLTAHPSSAVRGTTLPLQYIKGNLAVILNNLALLYGRTQRLQEAESHHKEALGIFHQLTRDNPQAYQPELAITLNSLANLYANTQRLQEAEKHYGEALEIRHQLVRDNPQAYQPELAQTLNNLARLYVNTQRLQKAKKYYEEALDIFRQLAKSNPDAYNIQLANTLFDLAVLYETHSDKAEKYFTEAAEVLGHFSDKTDPVPMVAELLKKIAEQQERQQKEYQARLEEDKKLGYLGTMATALAHEINQPVGSIRAWVGGARVLLRDGLFEADEVEPLLEHLQEQTERLKNIINTFQAFARGDRGPAEAVNPNHVVEQTVTLFEAQLKQHDIALHRQLAPEPALVWLNPFQLQEVLVNLLTNARDAVEGRKDAGIWIHTELGLNDEMVLRVEDNGPGVAEEFIERLFMPFTTTKSTEKGTGLGLHIAHKIIQAAGGSLNYEAGPRGGACFKITLPPLVQTNQE